MVIGLIIIIFGVLCILATLIETKNDIDMCKCGGKKGKGGKK